MSDEEKERLGSHKMRMLLWHAVCVAHVTSLQKAPQFHDRRPGSAKKLLRRACTEAILVVDGASNNCVLAGAQTQGESPATCGHPTLHKGGGCSGQHLRVPDGPVLESLHQR